MSMLYHVVTFAADFPNIIINQIILNSLYAVGVPLIDFPASPIAFHIIQSGSLLFTLNSICYMEKMYDMYMVSF